MCGIVGIVAKDTQIPAGLLDRATQSLAHRGPDDSGTVVLRKSTPTSVEIGLGNRRLAILDLSPLGHQPMHDPETSNWIVYNGEIYNFREIRRELEQEGIHLRSHTDTEVVLRAYARWGTAFLNKFRGMFAFAIWDPHEHHLLLARDPMGIKPLYYAQAGPYFLFASEVRTLLGTGLVGRKISHSGLLNYLTFGSAYDPFTLVEGIHALPPGHTLIWENGRITKTQYSDLLDDIQFDLSGSSGHGATKASELRTLLEGSVRSQLVSDVPVGIFLSGGIDSSALVSIVSRSGVTPSTFSIVFREADFSEAQHSRAIAQKFHTDHHEITVSQDDVLKALPDALRAMDLPTMDGVNTFFVSREARRAGVKVALSGLGGDEVFGGYSTFRTVPQMERSAKLLESLPGFARTTMGKTFSALAPKSDQNRKLASLIIEGASVLHPYVVARMLFTPKQSELLFNNPTEWTWQAATAGVQEFLNRSLSLDPINRVSYLELRCYMLNTLLRDADFMSMSQGLELRVPLIDYQLAKGVLSLPGTSKVGEIPKKLLVAALDGSLPNEIIYRPKRGFTLPFEHWMRQQLRPEIESVLNARNIDEGPLGSILNGREVERIWNDFLSGTMSWSRPWALYVLQCWCELQEISA
ncbi:MAG TPA: asparagine synthase (glutamine-hydrolyzing) [Candidatus Eisenbacteria bacterium]|nr:asparagine synthase (glutamine-hydrolyzing) [Candidatus Eisenbacteria bacterium]